MVQIYSNLLAGQTGQLSLVTQIMNTGGNLVRTFTTAVIYMQDTQGDSLGMVVMVVSFICNCIITLQVTMYQARIIDKKQK